MLSSWPLRRPPAGSRPASCWLPAAPPLASRWPPAGFLPASCWLPAGFLLASCRLSVGPLLASCWHPAGFLLASWWLSAGPLPASFWPPAGFLLASCRLPAALQLASGWHPTGLPAGLLLASGLAGLSFAWLCLPPPGLAWLGLAWLGLAWPRQSPTFATSNTKNHRSALSVSFKVIITTTLKYQKPGVRSESTFRSSSL